MNTEKLNALKDRAYKTAIAHGFHEVERPDGYWLVEEDDGKWHVEEGDEE